MKRTCVGIYGGTFDPVHYGHLTAAKNIQEQLALEEVRMVVSARPPHREKPRVDEAERYHLLQLAVQNSGGLVADDCEIKRTGPSYMVDTLSDYRQQMPDSALVLILGMEAFNSFTSWHRWEEIMSLAHIVITSRFGYANELSDSVSAYAEQFITDDKAQLRLCTHGKIYIQSVAPVDISSTQIRRRIKNKETLKDLMPDCCMNYINQHSLYT